MAAKRKKSIPQDIEAKIRTNVVDYKERALNQFLNSYKDKNMWLRFNESCFIRVKVIDSGNFNDYENVLVKVIKYPKWLKNVNWGLFLDSNKSRKTWNKLKKFDKIYVNHLSLYTSKSVSKIIESLKLIYSSNMSACTMRIKQINDEMEIMNSVQTSIEKILK